MPSNTNEPVSNDTDNFIQRIEVELPKSTPLWFFISLSLAVVWTIYLAYYNSRVIGLLATFIANKLQKYGRINIGSLSMSVLSGKIMFRAVHFITEDFSVRVEYGWIIIKWWRPYVYRELGEDMSHGDARLFMFIDGFQVHVYNRSGTYDRLERLFGLSTGHGDEEDDKELKQEKSSEGDDRKSSVSIAKNNLHWRDLIPVIKADITTCRFVFGNQLIPNTLIVHLDDSHVTYTTTPPSTPFDQFMHELSVKSDNLRIMFVPSDKYTGGIIDEPPRMMGEGFVLMQSTDVKLHYYMDEPGLVPYEPEMVELADGETVTRRTYPTMGLDIQCGKNTDFNYGPWADRQREFLWKFFYPSDYQPLVPTKIAEAGERRQFKTFEFRMNIVADSTFDVLYTKNSVTQAVHMNMGQGSYVEASVPWITEETGYTSMTRGQLLLLEATTSMQFRSLLECETLDFNVTGYYPLEWNAHQDWKYSFTACKASVFLIFQHKHFFSDLIEDWSTKSVPDVFHYVPYTYNVNILINQFELITVCNEYNWIDTSSQNPENAHVAVCGDIFDMSMQIPYTDFLPVTNSIGFIFKVENAFLRLFLPDNNTSRHVIIALSENMKIVDRDGNLLPQPFCYDIEKQWRRLTERSSGWVDCWMTSNVSLSITYKYHPMPPLMKPDTHHISPPSVEDFLATPGVEEAYPLRPIRLSSAKPPDDFDAGDMAPDLISVELEVAPSVLCLYGSLLRNILHLKENYLGEDQHYTDFYDSPSSSPHPLDGDGIAGPLTEREVAEKEFDARKYRPFSVTVSVTLHDIQAHLVKNCNMDVPCPSVYVERVGFELDKRYYETKLQVLISPAVLIARDNVERETDQSQLKEGHVALSGLQVRGHAMFSHVGLPLESETLEYAWLVEATVGDVSGKLTSPQIQNIVEFVQTFIMLVEDSENSLLLPRTYTLCQHMVPQADCKKAPHNLPCQSSEDIKYRMTRASVDSINIHLVEDGSALNVQIFPIRLSTCNLHGENTRSGITGLIEHISMKQYISTSPIRHDTSQPEVWLESGGLSLGPIKAEAAMALPNQESQEIQHQFLAIHDAASQRLWFMWPGNRLNIPDGVIGKCGCLGGCTFFGNNRNGVGFFHPKKFHDLTPTAVCKISPAGMDPGFGQSLLHKDKLVFEIVGNSGWLSPNREFVFTRGYMSDITTPDTPLTSITVIEEFPHVDTEQLPEGTSVRRKSQITKSPTIETQSISSGATTTTPSDVFNTDSTGINPFDTLKSVDSVVLRESEKGFSDDHRSKTARSQSMSSSSSPPPFSPSSRSSIMRSPSSRSPAQSPSGRSSVHSVSSSFSRSKHGSHYDTARQVSTMSLESEMYYSAEEDARSSSDPIPVFPQQSIQDINSSESGSIVWGKEGGVSPRMMMDSSDASHHDRTVVEKGVAVMSSSSSHSTLSYMSADTEADETLSMGMQEELSMVDLHHQVNKAITKSPVLLPCYSNHLTRLQCKNWSARAPFPSRYHGLTTDPSMCSLSSAGQSAQHGQAFSAQPHFIKTKQGFSTRIMKAKDMMFPLEKPDTSESWDNIEEPLLDAVDGVTMENACRTTGTVKLKGAVDIMLTPLLLESFQRLCEAVTPTLTRLHPASILDGLHSRCLDRLKSQNRLKKAESGTDAETPDTDNDEAKGTAEIKTSSYQALITVPRINVCVLQAGMVEELISFSALDHIHELTCVSLMGVSIEDICCQLLSNSHSCKTSHAVLPNLLNASPVSTKGRVDGADTDKDDVPEILREEDVGTVRIKAIHLQLRRLLKDSNFSEDIILTAIPEQKSKVMFTFENDVTKLFSPMSLRSSGKVKRSASARTEKESSTKRPTFVRYVSHDMGGADDKHSLRHSRVEENPFDAAPKPKLLRQRSISQDKPEDLVRQKTKEKLKDKQSIGYIMFECGLEDINITAVRRLGYKEKLEPVLPKQTETENIAKSVEEMQDTAKVDIETAHQSSSSHSKAQSSQGHSSSSVSQGPSTNQLRPVIVGSQEVYTSSNSVHSWDSRVSIPSDSGSLRDETPVKGDASSGTLHLKTVWFNFAAPPPLPIKRKADFTKYDWNLLSTATPAINAWLNPLDRLMTSARTLAQELTHRTNTVMACVMTVGLDVQSIHMPHRSKYNRITNFSRTLQYDASCQLLTVLRRYLHQCGTLSIEQAVSSDSIPQLITIQKGILALTRQWKNVLYMPQLSSYNFKTKKHRPYTVSFAVTDPEEDGDDNEDAASANFNVLDERSSLLEERAESLQSVNRRFGDAAQNGDNWRDPSASGQRVRHTGTRQLHRVFESPQRDTNPHMTGILRNESVNSFQTMSGISVDAPVGPTPPSTPYKSNISRQNLRSKVDDLYRWMTMQQEGFNSPQPMEDETATVTSVKRQDSFLEAFGRGLSQEDSHTDVNAEHYTLGTSIMQLADAQNLFKPFLQSIGLHVENVRPTAMMKNFGGNLSLQGMLDVLKIQIADSVRSKGKGKGKSRRSSKMTDQVFDASAFLCEKFTLTVSMRDISDFEKKEADGEDRFKKFPFKFAMHKLEAKPATLQVNLLVNCQSVTQNVDMPLLRLIHQFVTMIGNVNETRIELKQGHSTVDWIRTHRKQDSKGSTSSGDTAHSEASRTGARADEPMLSSSKTNIASEVKTPDSSKLHRHKPSITSFKFPFDTIRPERLGFPSSLKKSTFKSPKDLKKPKDSSKPTATNRSDLLTPPRSLNLSDALNIEMVDTSSPALAEKTIVDEIQEGTPQCWKTLYHLLELYSTMPETKTIGGQRASRPPLPVIEEEASEKANTSTPSGSVKTRIDLAMDEEAAIGSKTTGGFENTPLARSTFSRTRFKQSIYIGDSVPLVVFGIAKLEKVKILAVLKGLKLEAELRNVHASGAIKEKVKGFLQRKSSESSVTVHVGHTRIVLLEGPTLQTVVTVNVAKSQALHTTVRRRGKGHNSALVSVGEIEVDIPQHPVVLHGMLTRGTNQLSSTLQEFRRPISRTSRNMDMDYGTLDSKGSGNDPSFTSTLPRPQRVVENKKPVTLHIHLKAVLQGITIGASLLPSLKAQHKTGPITISGMTLKKARFTLDLPHHTLSFKSKVTTQETSIPSSASIDLPPIHVYADYRHYSANAPVSEALTEGLMLKEGSYLNGVAEVGMFEHSLTTDLLNHLVFVQKVFMKEVNELLQKVSGSDRPVHPFSDPSGQEVKTDEKDQLLYSFHFRLKGIQITATTPTASAVRLETEAIDLEVSNRVQMASQEANPNIVYEDNQKVFIKAQVDLNLALGQLLKNPLFEEADPEFQTMAFFKTKIGIRNALQDEMIPGVSTDQEALLINLTRPIVLAQPMAFDKAVLVWLNYKNAYEYWTEQRLALNKEVQTATQQVINRLPHITPATTQALSTLFLQLTVDDIGLCLPIAPLNSFGQTRFIDEPGAAVVLTIESTQISACSSGSLVSKGMFTGFCLRIAEDFETSLDEWKPNPDDVPVMNACVVPEGTYEVCSQTINKQSTDPNSNAKWILNIKWQMQGIDVHLDTNLGKRLSALGHTLTSLTGEEDEDFIVDEADGRLDVSLEDVSDIQPDPFGRRTSIGELLPKSLMDEDPKQRARLLERMMNEQAKVVQDLKELGASQTTIEAETRKLEELKGLIFYDFRREVLSRIKKQSDRASVIKDKLGIGSTPAHIRSRSYGGRSEKKHRESSGGDHLNPNICHVRGASDSADGPEYAPPKVQFGGTVSTTYTPPQTPEDTPQHKAAQRGGDGVGDIPVAMATGPPPVITMEDTSSSSLTEDSYTSSDETDGATLRRDGKDLKWLEDQKSMSSPSVGSGGSKTLTEPNVDFELDVNVFIDSGSCVLHPKESKEEETKRNKREKTPTPAADPHRMKKQESFAQGQGNKKQPAPQQPVIEKTVFFLPGVDVKVYYNSKTDHLISPTSTLNADLCGDQAELKLDDAVPSGTQRLRQGVKKASLYAWLSLQSLPEEMIISPCLLDYLEQALEPIPISASSQIKKDLPMPVNDADMDINASYSSIGGPMFLGSFPVDVVVFIRVESSIIRFNCLPVSRVECLLKVPSLELVFSSKRSDAEANMLPADGTPPLKAKWELGGVLIDLCVRKDMLAVKEQLRPPTVIGCPTEVAKKMSRERNLSGNFGRDSRARTGSAGSEANIASSSGGLSVTGCLSDFSLYIFHPYGAGQRKAGLQTSPRILGSIQEQTILSDINRKDSLSLNLEFVNLNISRTRKLEVKTDSGLTDKFNIVRFSAVCDIGSAAFKYDMRRLQEILSFPKAWYRRNLARRLFLGDESWVMEDEDTSSVSSTTSSLSEGGSVFLSPSKPCTSSPTLHEPGVHSDQWPVTRHHRRGSSGDKIRIQISPDFRNELADRISSAKGKASSAPQSPSDALQHHGLPDFHSSSPQSASATPNTQARSRMHRRNSQAQGRHASTRSAERKSANWQTLVLYAVNLSQLDVNFNMSNVMGNTVWHTRDIKSQGRLSIDSLGHKDLMISAGLGGSHLDSKGGVVGGNVDLQDVSTNFECIEDPRLGKDPIHEAVISLEALEGRVDYMGSSVLMTRLSNMNLSLRDEWKIEKSRDVDAPLATSRPAMLFAHADLGWDKFHLLISRSTTPDLIKIVSKLEEFIMQQFTSSRRALGAMGPIPGSARHRDKHRSSDEDSFLSELRHHRHWQKALSNITGCRFSMLPTMLPKEGMILGGTLTLHGINLSLGCFHGINFRSKSWALFVINEPYIGFATEAQKTKNEGIHVVQDLTFFVGHNTTSHLQGKHMAYVLKMSRGHSMPPTFTSAHEWFHYAFATSDIKDLDAFPRMQRAGSESPSDYRKSRKYTDYNHDSEMIFALPSMQLQLRTKHHQLEQEPMEDDEKPVIECSFVTEFEDHIFVAMDAEVFLFLHDLVMSYIREKDKGTRTSVAGSGAKTAKSPTELDKKKMTDPLTVLQQDWRRYECKTWQLEPTVRLLHWASKQIDPVGVDYVLQKLGFTHARVTIPKWMQRGFMDPCDKILSVLVSRLITLLGEAPEAELAQKL